MAQAQEQKYKIQFLPMGKSWSWQIFDRANDMPVASGLADTAANARAQAFSWCAQQEPQRPDRQTSVPTSRG